jgi:hypothetical protein
MRTGTNISFGKGKSTMFQFLDIAINFLLAIAMVVTMLTCLCGTAAAETDVYTPEGSTFRVESNDPNNEHGVLQLNQDTIFEYGTLQIDGSILGDKTLTISTTTATKGALLKLTDDRCHTSFINSNIDVTGSSTANGQLRLTSGKWIFNPNDKLLLENNGTIIINGQATLSIDAKSLGIELEDGKYSLKNIKSKNNRIFNYGTIELNWDQSVANVSNVYDIAESLISNTVINSRSKLEIMFDVKSIGDALRDNNGVLTYDMLYKSYNNENKGLLDYATGSHTQNIYFKQLENATITNVVNGINGGCTLSGVYGKIGLATGTTGLSLSRSLTLTGGNEGGNVVFYKDDNNIEHVGDIYFYDNYATLELGRNNAVPVRVGKIKSADGRENDTLITSGTVYTDDVFMKGYGQVYINPSSVLYVNGNIDTDSWITIEDSATLFVSGDITTNALQINNGGKLLFQNDIITKANFIGDNFTLYTEGNIEVNFSMNISNSELTAGNFTVKSRTPQEKCGKYIHNSKINVKGILQNISGLEIDDSIVDIGALSGSARLDINNNSVIRVGRLDPSYGSVYLNGETQDNSVFMTIGKIEDSAGESNFGYSVTLKDNVYLSIGSPDVSSLLRMKNEVLQNDIWLNKKNKNDISVALEVDTPLVFTQHATESVQYALLNLGGDESNMTYQNRIRLEFGKNSLLVVDDNAALNGNVAFSFLSERGYDINAEIEDGARIAVKNPKVNEYYAILGSNIKWTGADEALAEKSPEELEEEYIQVDAWDAEKYTGTPMILMSSFLKRVAKTSLRTRGPGEEYWVYLGTRLNSARNWVPKLDESLADIIDQLFLDQGNDPNSQEPGAQFLSRATYYAYIARDEDLVSKTVESAARIVVIGGVPQMTRLVSDSATSAPTQRLSLGNPSADLKTQRIVDDGNGDGNAGDDGLAQDVANERGKNGLALWLLPLYQTQSAWGAKAGNFGIDWSGAFGGVSLGADWTFYSRFRAGLSFSIGGGTVTGSGELAKTANDFSFWSVGVYGGWAIDNFALSGDVGYTTTTNSLKQELPDGMRMEALKGDVNAHAISAGLRAEYKFETGLVDVIPHAGARYMHLTVDDYEVTSGGRTVLEGDAMEQNLWSFPVGVTVSKDVPTGGEWTMQPRLDLSVIPVTGDLDAKSTVRFTGCRGEADLKARTVDPVSYQGSVGVQFGNDTVKMEVNYALQVSEHTTAHGIWGMFRYEF